MVCTTVVITGDRVPPLPPTGDKYYDCVDGKCIEKVGGQYKNDLKCAGKCPAADNTGTYILLAAAAVGAALIFGGKK